MKDNKLLISAYTLSPIRGSEPGMAWNWIVSLARHYRIHVITSGEYRIEIESKKSMTDGLGIEFSYVRMPSLGMAYGKKQGNWSFYLFYKYWQYLVYLKAKECIREQNYFAVHQLNMIGFREPGFLHKLPITSVWGPVGGLHFYPTQMESKITLQSLKYSLKNYLTKLQVLYDPYVLNALNNFTIIIASNSTVSKNFRELTGHYLNVVNEAGMDDKIVGKRVLKSDGIINVIWVGRDLHSKNLNMALEVMSSIKVPKGKVVFHVVGVERSFNTDTKNGVKIINHHRISKKEVLDLFSKSHIHLFTSLSEGTPHVVLEAANAGLWTICFDICGQQDVIHDKIGDKLQVQDYKSSKQELIGLVELRLAQIASEGLIMTYEDRGPLEWNELIDNFKELSYDKILD